jgi:hypothetical protein
MSKAFTRETDAEEDDGLDEADALPAGVKNYMTREGFERLQAELRHLKRVERPKVVETVAWAAGNGDRSENGDYIYGKKRLREIDRRMRFLAKRLESAEVVDPAQQKNKDRVYFGATVTYANEDGGADRADRRHRRGAAGRGRGELDLAHRPRAPEGRGGRHGRTPHADRSRNHRSGEDRLSGQVMRGARGMLV